MMNGYLKKITGILLAAALVIGFGFYASDARLKATDEEVLPEVVSAPAPDPEPAPAEPAAPTEVVVEENEDYVLSEVVTGSEETQPADTEAEETEEPAEPDTDAAPEEETAEEEAADAFDVAAAYKYYLTLTDAEKEEYLNSLTPENREALLRYIEQMENGIEEEKEDAAAEEEDKEEPKITIKIWDNRGSNIAPGQTITLYSEVEGVEGLSFSYRWQYNRGCGWEDVPGGNSATYSYTATIESLSWKWRLAIDY